LYQGESEEGRDEKRSFPSCKGGKKRVDVSGGKLGHKKKGGGGKNGHKGLKLVISTRGRMERRSMTFGGSAQIEGEERPKRSSKAHVVNRTRTVSEKF